MLSYPFYTLVIGGTVLLICGILLLLPQPVLVALSKWANRVLLTTDSAIAPYRKILGVIFIAAGLWAFYRLYLFLQKYPL